MTRAPTQTEIELTGKAMLPDLVVLIYGLYRLFREWPDDVSWHTYFLIGASIVTAMSIVGFAKMVFDPIAPRPGLKAAATAYSLMIPYALSVYVFFYLGLGSLCWLYKGYSTGLLLYGMFWAFAGYRLVYAMWQLSEVSNYRSST